jgi:hypothetical protein
VSSSVSWQALRALVGGLQLRAPEQGWRLAEEHTSAGGTPWTRYAVVRGEEVIVEAEHVVGELAGVDILDRWAAWAKAHPGEVPPPRAPAAVRWPRDGG